MKHSIILTIALLFSFALTAQEEFVAPSAKSLTKFSFEQLTGGIIIVHARLDDIADTLNFILDTGSGGISLDSATVEKYKLTTEPSDRQIRGIAGIKKVTFTKNHTLHFPGLQIDNLNFHINEYDLLTSVYGIKIDGIIGYSFFRRYIISINYDKLELEIFSPGRFKYANGGYMLHPNFSTLPLQEGSIEDERKVDSRFIFDTGAGLCLLLSSDFMDDSCFLKKKRKKYITQAEGLGGKRPVELTVLKNFFLGKYKFRDVPTYIFKDSFNVTSYPLMGGIIGNDLIRRFNIVINYPESVIFIKANNFFNTPFDYSYNGLSIYLIDGEIRVENIVKGSPADKAGFKTDDILFAVDNNFSKNIQAYRLALQRVGETVKVVIVRNGEFEELYMKARSILD